VHELAHVDVGDLAADLVDVRAIVLGAPTVLGGLHPAALTAVNLVKALRLPLKYAAVLSSYGWGGGALRQAGEVRGPTGIEVVGAVEVHGAPDADAEAQAASLVGDLAAKIRSSQHHGGRRLGALSWVQNPSQGVWGCWGPRTYGTRAFGTRLPAVHSAAPSGRVAHCQEHGCGG